MRKSRGLAFGYTQAPVPVTTFLIARFSTKTLHFSKESYLSRLLILERMLRTNSLSFSQ